MLRAWEISQRERIPRDEMIIETNKRTNEPRRGDIITNY
jgi:hypothetical protein